MFTLDELIEATDGQLVQGPEGGRAKSVCIDSRIITKGQAFVAIKGEVFDGHDFLRDVVAKGIRILVVHKPVLVANNQVSIILVKDTIRALGQLACFHRLRFSIPVIALTGSAGKTTTKEMIAAVLSRKYRVLKNNGTQNNHIGVPLTLLKLKPSHQVAILECATNRPGDIPWLASVSRPNVTVFTNIGESHLERLRTTERVLKEKWSLVSCIKSGGCIIINADDPLLSSKVQALRRRRVIMYGIQRRCRYRAHDIHIEKGRHLLFTIEGQRFELKTCGRHQVYNALAAFACGRLLSVPAKDMAAALQHFVFPAGRGQIVRLGSGWLINDSYNANPVSMRCAVQTLQALPTMGKRIMVSADMLELGSKAKELHRSIGRVVARSGIDVLITVGALSRHMAAQARRYGQHIRTMACTDIESAQKQMARVFHNGDSVLVKGSRRMATERIVDFLLMPPKMNNE